MSWCLDCPWSLKENVSFLSTTSKVQREPFTKNISFFNEYIQDARFSISSNILQILDGIAVKNGLWNLAICLVFKTIDLPVTTPFVTSFVGKKLRHTVYWIVKMISDIGANLLTIHFSNVSLTFHVPSPWGYEPELPPASHPWHHEFLFAERQEMIAKGVQGVQAANDFLWPS